MAMSIKIVNISEDSIQPSTPTPDHLQHLNLSLIDQIFPLCFVPVILFYSTSPIDDHQATVSDLLKRSLSKTLTHFYPLAGRIKDNNFIDCNDEGIEFFESGVNGNISDFMKRDQLHHLLPYDFESNLNVIVENDSQLIVQLNFFDCGGIAISVCISHKIADAATLTAFINTWAEITRNLQTIPTEKPLILSPTFDSSILYPPREGISSSFWGEIADEQEQEEEEKTVKRRFVFDGTKIANLRARNGGLTTRVMAVTALLWKTAMAAAASSSSSPKPSIANMVVDMRRRLDPPLSQQSFGNLVMLATTTTPFKPDSSELDLINSLKDSISKINSETLKMLQGEEGFFRFQEFMKMAMGMEEKLNVYTFNSWCRFPFYEADFGWGRPNWVAIGSQPFKNNFVLVDDRRDGIEAWVCLGEKDMAIFEQDQELLEFVSLLD